MRNMKEKSGNAPRKDENKIAQTLKKKTPAMEVLLRLDYPKKYGLSRQLFSAIEEKDGDKLKSLMEQGADLNFTFEEVSKVDLPNLERPCMVTTHKIPLHKLMSSGDVELMAVAVETLKAERKELLDGDNEEETHQKLKENRLVNIDYILKKIETKLKAGMDKLRREVESSILRNPNFMNDDGDLGSY